MIHHLSGDVTNLRGDISYLSGDVSNISGYVSYLRGDVSNIRGNIDLCDISDDERSLGINIEDLIK